MHDRRVGKILLRPGPLRLGGAGVAFTMTLGAVGVRAAPGVMIVPLERAFGWSAGTISGAVSLNILLMGLTGPFITGLMETSASSAPILLPWRCCCGRGIVHVDDRAVAVVRHLGIADGGRRERRRRWHGLGGREPLVRHASRAGDGAADLGATRRGN